MSYTSRPLASEIIGDHKEIMAYYQQYKNAPNKEKAIEWFNQFTWLLAIHSVAEELVLYPLLDTLGDKGKDLAEQSRLHHQQIKVDLKWLDDNHQTAIKTPEFDQRFSKLASEIEEHVNLEESEDLKLLEKVSADQEDNLASMFKNRKKLVPTRSHPLAPTNPPTLGTLAGLMAAPLDAVKDAFKSWPEPQEISRVAQAAREA